MEFLFTPAIVYLTILLLCRVLTASQTIENVTYTSRKYIWSFLFFSICINLYVHGLEYFSSLLLYEFLAETASTSLSILIFFIFHGNEFIKIMKKFKEELKNLSLTNKLYFFNFTFFCAIPIRIFINNKFSIPVNLLFYGTGLISIFNIVNEAFIIFYIISLIPLIIIFGVSVFLFEEGKLYTCLNFSEVFGFNENFFKEYYNFFFENKKKNPFSFYGMIMIYPTFLSYYSLFCLTLAQEEFKIQRIFLQSGGSDLDFPNLAKSLLYKEHGFFTILLDKNNPDLLDRLYYFSKKLITYTLNFFQDLGETPIFLNSFCIYIFLFLMYLALYSPQFSLFSDISKFPFFQKFKLLFWTFFFAIPHRVIVFPMSFFEMVLFQSLFVMICLTNFEYFSIYINFWFYLLIDYMVFNNYEKSINFQDKFCSFFFNGDRNFMEKYVKFFYGNPTSKQITKVVGSVVAGSGGIVMYRKYTEEVRNNQANERLEQSRIELERDLREQEIQLEREKAQIEEKRLEEEIRSNKVAEGFKDRELKLQEAQLEKTQSNLSDSTSNKDCQISSALEETFQTQTFNYFFFSNCLNLTCIILIIRLFFILKPYNFYFICKIKQFFSN